MTRADVTLYRDAFDAFLDCAVGTSPAKTCSDAWTTAITPLLDDQSGSADDARAYAGYYVENILRKPEARSAWCPAQ